MLHNELSLHKLQKVNRRFKRVVSKYNKEIIMHLRGEVMEWG